MEVQNRLNLPKERDKLLHQFFEPNDFNRNPVVVFDQGWDGPEVLLHNELTQLTRFVSDIVTTTLGCTGGGFIAVAFKQSTVFPAVLLGLVNISYLF